MSRALRDFTNKRDPRQCGCGHRFDQHATLEYRCNGATASSPCSCMTSEAMPAQ